MQPGMVLDQLGRSQATWALVNLTGLAIVVLFAYMVSAIKNEWWRKAIEEKSARQAERDSAASPAGSRLSPSE